jgi:xanthine dehydrogenase accessory factor
MRRATLAALLEAKAAGIPAVVVTRLPSGQQALVLKDRQIGELSLDTGNLAHARRLLGGDESLIIEGEGERLFLHALSPPPRLVIVGAVHIAEPLARMAECAGYNVILIDPRRAFAEREQFRSFTVIGVWPDEALSKLKLDERTAVVTLTHDPKLDDPALRVALRSPAFYIGCLGSRKTHAARLERLRAAGVSTEEVSRIHGPVGLAIGARTPAEIAISILAELTRVRRGKGGQ